jgi:lipid-A-disaccharide synthase
VIDVLVVAGEASGDQHAADLVLALAARRSDLRFFGMGGPRLAAAGVELTHGAHEISVMGLVEVLPRIPRILGVLRALEAQARARRPACAILVDVPDFNLRLAPRLKALGIPVVWYVAPMVWAWRAGRTAALARDVDRVLCILPFEERFLVERGVPATYVGSPVLDQVPPAGPPGPFREALGLAPEGPLLALLPGSRPSELRRILPTLVEVGQEVRRRRPGTRLVVPVAPGLAPDAVRGPFEAAGLPVTVVEGRAPEVVGACDVAVVASGTATLEAGLMRRPLVAVYRLNALSHLIASRLIKVPHFCLVNLLAGREVVPELLQAAFTAPAVADALEPLWEGPARERCLAGLDAVRASLGPPGASARAAALVSELLDGRGSAPGRLGR